MANYEAIIEEIRRRKEGKWLRDPVKVAYSLSRGSWQPYKHAEWSLRYVAERVLKGNFYCVINEPPRHGKSTRFSLWLPVWFLSERPYARIMLISYQQGVANEFSRSVRRVMEEYPHVLKVLVRKDERNVTAWKTVWGGGVYASGIGGPILGRGFDLAIIDDPYKNWQQALSLNYNNLLRNWFDTTFWTRRQPGASVLLVMSRWTQEDLAGYVLSKYSFEKIEFPAFARENDILGRQPGEPLCDEMFPRDLLDRLQATNPTVFEAMYQQRPSSLQGFIISRDMIQHYSEIPQGGEIVFSVDTKASPAKTGSFAVIQVWKAKNGKFYLLWQYRHKAGFSAICQEIQRLLKEYKNPIAILIEQAGHGDALAEYLTSQGVSGVIRVAPRLGKKERLMAVEPLFASGRVFVPHPGPKGLAWAEMFVNEIVSFPESEYSDQVDACTQALSWLWEREKKAGDEISIISLTGPGLGV
jgi:predicted phage terminase large subunit-like protein